MPTRAVFFDIDDTLYSTASFAARARKRAMQSMVDLGGLQVTADDLYAELREVITEFGSNDSRHYERLLRRFSAEDLGGHPHAVLVATGVRAYHDTKVEEFCAFPGVLDDLKRLRAVDGLILGIITEGLEVKQAEKILRLGIYPYLDRNAIFISDSIGISKPNPKLWLRACETVGVEPAECVYVGDNPVKDIPPAHSLGMLTIRIRHPESKYASVESGVPPDHEIDDFASLLVILEEHAGLTL
ncbi:MAG: TIGR02253 family HAD-type hydrolase [Planctomycetota bacterium]|jgi:putative hydrolase of the HAD superfamily